MAITIVVYPAPPVAQESRSAFDFVDRFARLSSSQIEFSNSNGSPSLKSNAFSVDSLQKKREVRSLVWCGKRVYSINSILAEFTRSARVHCEKNTISFWSRWACLADGDCRFSKRLLDDGFRGVISDEVALNCSVNKSRPKKVLILMSDTGGGHRSSAEAIKMAFEEEYGDDYEVFITDLWSDHTPWPFNQLPRSYKFLVKYGPLWKMAYYGTVPRLIHQSNFAATSLFIASEIAKGLLKYQPDIIVSVHPLMQHVPIGILKAKGLLQKIIFATVVTDLSSCHPTWFHKLVTKCYCPTTDVAKQALDAGLKPAKIKVFGLPVRPSFVKPILSKRNLRRELGMDECLPSVLLMGGGEGMGPIEETARALGKHLYNEALGEPVGQLLVICGHNKKLTSRLISVDWKIPVRIMGFISNMEECMGACDCIITKAGPGTISEAMIRGLPIILNDYIAGQEAGNVPYVVNNGLGKFSKLPKEIASIVAQWFGPNSKELLAMSRNAQKLARPDAVFKIVHDLHQLVRCRKSFPACNSSATY